MASRILYAGVGLEGPDWKFLRVKILEKVLPRLEPEFVEDAVRLLEPSSSPGDVEGPTSRAGIPFSGRPSWITGPIRSPLLS